MNIIPAKIKKIKKHQNITSITLDALGFEINMVALEVSDSVDTNTDVIIQAKATNISLSKELNSNISISNQLKGVVQEILIGEILCVVKIDIQGIFIESIITQKSALRMNIQIGEEIFAFIKASDISLGFKN